MKQWVAAVCLVAGLVQQGAFAKEWFEDAKLRTSVVGEKVNLDDTLGGYPIYQGSADWRYVGGQTDTSTGRADSISMGSLRLTATDSKGLVAIQAVAANLQNNNGAYWTGNPCSADHLVVRSKSKGRIDDCMTIDASSIPVGFSRVLVLEVRITESASSGRYYFVDLVIPVERLGLAGTSMADWTASGIQDAPARKKLLDALTAWAEKLHDGAGKLMAYSKPTDAFKQVPSFTELLVFDDKTTTSMAASE